MPLSLSAAVDEQERGGIIPVKRRLGAGRNAKGAIVSAKQPISTNVTSTSFAFRAAAASHATAASPTAATPASATPTTSTTALPLSISLGANTSTTYKLRTTFLRESDEYIQRCKEASRRPLDRSSWQPGPAGYLPSLRVQDFYARNPIPIPIRPEWRGKGLDKEGLEKQEHEYFQRWLHQVYTQWGSEHERGRVLTGNEGEETGRPLEISIEDRLNHFEHNLEVWRQLWRVVERSDVLALVVDARFPLLNFPPSLVDYVTRHSNKPLILVLNKIDLLPAAAVQEWVEWFHRHYPQMDVVTFSSFPHERREKLDMTIKSKAKRGRGRTLMKPFGSDQLEIACRKHIAEYPSLRALPESIRRNFSFEPTLLRGGTQAVDRIETAYAGADEYMKGGGDDVTGVSSLSKQLKEMGVLQKRKHNKSQVEERSLYDGEDEDDKGKDENEDEWADKRTRGGKKGRSKGSLTGSSKKKNQRIWASDDDAKDVEETSEGDEEEKHKIDAEDDAVVAANRVRFANAFGRLEDEAEDDEFQARSSSSSPSFITIGCLGQPNAGKSSLINSICGKKLVSVSHTPGHTKYLQTLFLNPFTRLCDAPGLVFPCAAMPRAMQVIAGSYPIAQTRDPYTAVQVIAERIPLEKIYKLQPSPTMDPNEARQGDEGGRRKVDHDRAPFTWSAWSLCESFAHKKGFLTRQGAADVYRAANFILREVLDGVISFYFLPPNEP